LMQTRCLSLGLLVAIIGPACKRQEAHDEKAPAPAPPAQAVTPTPANADSGASGWDSPEAVRLSGVQYTAPTRLFGVLGVTSPEFFDSIGPGYKIGTFVDGRYRGARDVTTPCISDSQESRTTSFSSLTTQMAVGMSGNRNRSCSFGQAHFRQRVSPLAQIHSSQCERSCLPTRSRAVLRPSGWFLAAARAIRSRSRFVTRCFRRSASTGSCSM